MRKVFEMEEKKNIMSYEFLQQLEEELRELKEVRRAEIAQKIKEAREQGDLSENAEYDAAKDEQRDNELRIEELEKTLKNAEVFLEEDVVGDVVSLGSTVTIVNTANKAEFVYKIVGSKEADSRAGKISNESPVGRALIGYKKGDVVTVAAPVGEIKFKITKVEKQSSKEKKAPAKKSTKKKAE